MSGVSAPSPVTLETRQIRRLELLSIIEALTLVTLVGVAVPLKHVLHADLPVRIMGPVHGLAFLLYIWTVLQTVAGGEWRGREAARLFLVAFVPFAGFATISLLRARAARLRAHGSAPA